MKTTVGHPMPPPPQTTEIGLTKFQMISQYLHMKFSDLKVSFSIFQIDKLILHQQKSPPTLLPRKYVSQLLNILNIQGVQKRHEAQFSEIISKSKHNVNFITLYFTSRFSSEFMGYKDIKDDFERANI